MSLAFFSNGFCFGIGFAVAGPSLAAGDGDSTNTGAKNCKSGQVWNKSLKKCVKASSGVLPDRDLYEQGRELALPANMSRAIGVSTRFKKNPIPVSSTISAMRIARRE